MLEMNIMKEKISRGECLLFFFFPRNVWYSYTKITGEIDFTGRDCNSVTGLLKLFFRELPEGIIPADLNSGAKAVFSMFLENEMFDVAFFLCVTLLH